MRLKAISSRRGAVLCATSLLLTFSVSPLHATSFSATWNGVGTSWTTATHWDITPAGPTFPNNNGVDTFDVTMATGANTFNVNLELDSLNFSATSLTGAQNLTINTGLTWSAGRFLGAGTTALAAASVSTLSTGDAPNYPALGASRQLTIAGTLNFSNNANLDLSGGASILNTGTFRVGSTVLVNDVEIAPSASNTTQIINDGIFDLQADGSIIAPRGDFDSSTDGFINNGTLVKSGGAGESGVDTFVLNTGVVQANAGTLRLLTYTQTAGRTDVNDSLRVGYFGVEGGRVTGAGTLLDADGDGLSVMLVGNSAAVAPGASQGNSVGTLTSEAGVVFDPGSRIEWQLSDATGTPGVGWDLLDVTNTVNGIVFNTTDTPGEELTLEISPLSLINFNPFTSYEWVVARTPTALNNAGITDFVTGSVLIDLSGWNTPPAGTFGVSATTGQLLLSYTAAIPEPVGAVVILGACGLLLRRRAVRPTLVDPTGDLNADSCNRVA